MDCVCEIERLLPEFYPLHTGFTTGSCATAAAKAALVALLTGKKVIEIDFKIPEGETLHMPIISVMIERGLCYSQRNQGCRG